MLVWVLRAALLCSALGLLLALIAPLGVRARLWTWVAGFVLVGASLAFSALGVVLSLATALLKGPRLRVWPGAGTDPTPFIVAGAAGGAVVLGLIGFHLYRLWRHPKIHDITTDVQLPPEFVHVLKDRGGATNPPQYPGPSVTNQQRRFYPDLHPVWIRAAHGEVFRQALSLARDRGWKIAHWDARTGRIEAVATTLFFGFKDDIAIRVTASGDGVRVDMRSKSRVGKGDGGTNARRIARYLKALKHANAVPSSEETRGWRSVLEVIRKVSRQ